MMKFGFQIFPYFNHENAGLDKERGKNLTLNAGSSAISTS
jgi:hypothetical protein